MNPLALLLGLLGVGLAGAGGGGGGSKGEVPVTTSTDDDDEDPVIIPVPDPEPEPEPDPEEDPVIIPVPDPEPEPDPVEDPIIIDDETPDAPDQTGDGSGSDGGDDTPIAPIGDGTVEVMAGRVATLAPADDDITEVRIVSGVEHGTITVNPDNSFALVMTLSDFTGSQSFSYEAFHADGSVTLHEASLDVVPGLQDAGWGTGSSHYMLETDENDRVIVETGENHTKVYISGSDEALSRADIAAREGLNPEDITGSWLASNGEYGQSEDLALDQEAGMELWSTVTPQGSETSNWLLLESGQEYSDLGRVLIRDTHGEDELHPLYIGSWGEGDKPVITSEFAQFQESSSNVVIQDIHFSGGIRILDASNMIFDNISTTDDEFTVMRSDGITVRNSDFTDVFREDSQNGGDWEAHADRIQGFYSNYTNGLLLEGNFFDHNGWEDGYASDGSGDSGQAPSMYSHNIYLGLDTSDVTLRDSIIMRASSVGAQVRSGGYIEDNIFIDNNIAMNTLGGSDGDGNYTLFADNVVTSVGYKDAVQIGARNWGAETRGELSGLVDNIIAHLADPNDPDDLASKLKTGFPYKSEGHYYDDTIVWNWQGAEGPSSEDINEQNVEGLDTAVLDQTTIQLFTAQLLGDPNATISDLADYLRAQADGVFDDIVDADLIIQFFQEGFGIAPDLRATEETLRFIPDDLGDGVRWDNRLNWSTDDLPGTQDGDSVDLGGNHVVYGGTTTIDQLDFGPGGQLDFYHGELTVDGGMTADEEGGNINIEGAGQLWANGYDGAGDLNVGVGGGRFANTGEMGNTNLLANGGQTILATGGAEFDVDASKTLAIFAEAAKVGFDGEDGGTAILDFHEGSTMVYAAEDGGLGTIEEFRSGAFGDEPNVQSGIDLGNATLEIDLSGLSTDAGSAFTLMDSDELVGLFDEATVGGLGSRDATIVVDYINDSVTLELTSGTGLVSVQTNGAEDDVDAGEEDLWAALTADHGVVAEAAPEPEEEDPLVEAA